MLTLKHIALCAVFLITLEFSSSAQTPTSTQAAPASKEEQRTSDETEVSLPTETVWDIRLNLAGTLTFRANEKTYVYSPWANLDKEGYQALLLLVGEIRQSSALHVQIAPEVNGLTPIKGLELRYRQHRITTK